MLIRSLPLLPSERQYHMSICHAKKFIWFRVAKVGSRSILRLFKDANVALDAEHPMSCHYPVHLYRNYFKFAFVRNPWDRLVSCWHNKVVDHNYFNFPDETWVKMQDFRIFVDYIIANPEIIQFDDHVCLQSNLIDLNQIDYLGRFERFERDLTEIVEILGLEQRPIARENASTYREEYRAYYDDDLRKKVARLYQKDISIFSYQF